MEIVVAFVFNAEKKVLKKIIIIVATQIIKRVQLKIQLEWSLSY